MMISTVHSLASVRSLAPCAPTRAFMAPRPSHMPARNIANVSSISSRHFGRSHDAPIAQQDVIRIPSALPKAQPNAQPKIPNRLQEVLNTKPSITPVYTISCIEHSLMSRVERSRYHFKLQLEVERMEITQILNERKTSINEISKKINKLKDKAEELYRCTRVSGELSSHTVQVDEYLVYLGHKKHNDKIEITNIKTKESFTISINELDSMHIESDSMAYSPGREYLENICSVLGF